MAFPAHAEHADTVLGRRLDEKPEGHHLFRQVGLLLLGLLVMPLRQTEPSPAEVGFALDEEPLALFRGEAGGPGIFAPVLDQLGDPHLGGGDDPPDGRVRDRDPGDPLVNGGPAHGVGARAVLDGLFQPILPEIFPQLRPIGGFVALERSPVLARELLPADLEILRHVLGKEFRGRARFRLGDRVKRALGQVVPLAQIIVNDDWHFR